MNPFWVGLGVGWLLGACCGLLVALTSWEDDPYEP